MRNESDAECGIGGSGAGARVGGRDGWGERAAGYREAAWHRWDRGCRWDGIGKNACDGVWWELSGKLRTVGSASRRYDWACAVPLLGCVSGVVRIRVWFSP